MMQRDRDAIAMPIVYCRDHCGVQAFIAERIMNFNPYRQPETARDVLDAAISRFGLLNCFYVEIRPH
jgi:hypothetical protein